MWLVRPNGIGVDVSLRSKWHNIIVVILELRWVITIHVRHLMASFSGGVELRGGIAIATGLPVRLLQLPVQHGLHVIAIAVL